MQPAVVQLEERRQRAQAIAQGRRLDLYTPIHKGIRAFFGATIDAAGRLDVLDPEDVTRVAAEVRGLIGLLRAHLHLENQFVHPAIEARRPGAARATANDHVEHECELEDLEARLLLLERAEDDGARARAAAELYRALASTAAENFRHMAFEESQNNARLWEAYTDDELRALHDALVGSIPPAEMALVLRWMVPALSPVERAAMLTELQAKLPRDAFVGLLGQVRPYLTEREWAKLTAAIGPLA
jgi:hypothetical protein